MKSLPAAGVNISAFVPPQKHPDVFFPRLPLPGLPFDYRPAHKTHAVSRHEILEQHMNVASLFFHPLRAWVVCEVPIPHLRLERSREPIGVPVRLGAPPPEVPSPFNCSANLILKRYITPTWEALEAVLPPIRNRSTTRLFCCGDLVAMRHPIPVPPPSGFREECLQRLFAGNTNKACAGPGGPRVFNPIKARESVCFGRSQYEPEKDLGYLPRRTLVQGPEQVNGFQILHGSPPGMRTSTWVHGA